MVAQNAKNVTQGSPPTSAQPQSLPRELIVLTHKQCIILDYFVRLAWNVFPTDELSKIAPYWKQLQTTRLYLDPQNVLSHKGILAAFRESANIAVMMGRTSGNLFVIDCETEAAYNFVLTELDERAIPIWAQRTPSGGGHFFFRARREVSNVTLGQLAKDIEIRGHGGYVIVAPSIIKCSDGIKRRYTWERQEGDLPHLIDLTRIDFLQDKSGEQIRLKFRRNTNRSELRDDATGLYRLTLDYIDNGHKLKGTRTRNIRLYKAASDLYQHGYTKADITARLLHIAVSSGLPQREAETTINSACKGTPKFERHTDEIPAWKRAQNWLASATFTGRTASVDKAVFRAAINIAARAPVDKVMRLTSREIADIAGITRKTASIALKRLVAAGLLVCKKFTDRISDAKCYEFGGVCVYPTYSVAINTVSSSGVITHTPLTDAAEREALGLTGFDLYRAMCRIGAPMSAKALAAASGIGLNAVRNALRTNHPLRTSGLVTLTADGYLARDVDDDELNELTQAPVGKRKARIQQHANERAQRATSYLIERLEKRYARIVTPAPADPPKGNVETLKCPNCGQHIAAVFGVPDKCAFCNDLTTWKPLPETNVSPIGDTPRDTAPARPVVQNFAPPPIAPQTQTVDVVSTSNADKARNRAQLDQRLSSLRMWLDRQPSFATDQRAKDLIPDHQKMLAAGDATAVDRHINLMKSMYGKDKRR